MSEFFNKYISKFVVVGFISVIILTSLLIMQSLKLVNRPQLFTADISDSMPSDPPNLPRIQASDITYLGSFSVPQKDSAGEPLTYGGQALGYNPTNNSLFFGCHDWYQKLAEVSIPAFGQTAAILQGCKDVTDGKLGTLGSGNVKLGGNLVSNGRLLTTAYVYYDATNAQSKSHGAGSLNLSQNDFSGFSGFTGASAPPRALAGYMTPIPSEWQTLFGGPALTGQGSLSIVSNSSDGPSATVFNPDMVGVGSSIPGKTVLLYPYPDSHPDFEAKGSALGGMAFPNGTRTVLFYGARAQLPYCYGTPEECPNTCGSSKGPHNQYKNAFWLYDANDLLKVKNGQLQPYQVREYAVAEVSDITAGNCASVNFGGATFDQQNSILYVTAVYGESPRVHAFRIGTPSSGGAASPAADTTSPTVSPVVPVTPPLSSSNTINVSNLSQLKNAVANLTSNSTILIADGTYNLDASLFLPQNLTNVTIKGASGNREAVIIKGAGMNNASVPFGFWIDNVSGVTFQDMTIRDIYTHGIIANGGVQNPVYRNLHIIDIGDQFLKNNPNAGATDGVDNGVMENCLLEYTTVAPDSYTNGLDVHHGVNWIVRNNTFKNFKTNGGLAGPAILMWNGSADTVVNGNTFINNQRDIALGLDNSKAFTDHARGVVSNNFIVRTNVSPADVPIGIFDSPGTKIYYNTILTNGTFVNAIEYRFARTTNVDIRNNLTDAAIQPRDGATGTTSTNVTSAATSMFVNASSGDLHLLSSATAAIDKGVAVSVTNDFDNQSRPFGAAFDVGADEFSSAAPSLPPSLPPSPVTPPPAIPPTIPILPPKILNIPGNFQFSRLLRINQISSDVYYLQQVLNSDLNTKVAIIGPGSSGQETMFFGGLTKLAVIKFQNKYAQEILAPLGLTQATGIVGPNTIKKLNVLLQQLKSTQ